MNRPRPRPRLRLPNALTAPAFGIGIGLFSPLVAAGDRDHAIVTQGNGKLAVVEPDGAISWEVEWGGIHDIHVLGNGNVMVQRMPATVVEIDRATKEVVWEYDSATSNGNAGKPVEVHAFQPLPGGRLMVAESGPARIIEVDRDGKLLKEVPLKVDNPNPHTDTRLARKLDSGNYLVCHEADGVLREYDGETGDVVWEFGVPLFGKEPKGGHGLDAFGNKLFAAVRLENGNTLIALGNGHGVIEVTPEKEIVWQIHQDEFVDEGIRFAWVTTLEVTPEGHYVIGNCHAGPGNPLVVAVDPSAKEVVWTFDGFDEFGNSVSNSQLLGVDGGTRR